LSRDSSTSKSDKKSHSEKSSLFETLNAKNIDVTQYSEAKASSEGFQKAKKELFKAFTKAGLGTWVKKPMEQDEFDISI